MFTGFDPLAFPLMALLRGRIAAYNMHLRAIADARGCDLVDLWGMRSLTVSSAWSPDRLHLNSQSHAAIASRAAAVLGVTAAAAGNGAGAAAPAPVAWARTAPGGAGQRDRACLGGRAPRGLPVGTRVRSFPG